MSPLNGGAPPVIFRVRRHNVRQPTRLADALNKLRKRVGGRQLDAIRFRPSAHLGQFLGRRDLVGNPEFHGLAIYELRRLHERRVRVDFCGGGADDIAEELDCLLPA
jgi:hypothetical protein